jgi:hypothetical protein
MSPWKDGWREAISRSGTQAANERTGAVAGWSGGGCKWSKCSKCGKCGKCGKLAAVKVGREEVRLPSLDELDQKPAGT